MYRFAAIPADRAMVAHITYRDASGHTAIARMPYTSGPTHASLVRQAAMYLGIPRSRVMSLVQCRTPEGSR